MRRADGVRWGIALLVVAVAGTPACVPRTPMFGVLPTSPSLIALASTDEVRADAERAVVGDVAPSQDVVAPVVDPIEETPSALGPTTNELQGAR
jgi:hypothetical protein